MELYQTLSRLVQQMGLYVLIVAVGSAWVKSTLQRGEPKHLDTSLHATFLRLTVFGSPKMDTDDGSKPKPPQRHRDVQTVVFCTLGLLVSYLTWGVLQEKLVSYEYSTGRMESSTFLVFTNRIVACIVAAGVVWWERKRDPIQAPLYPFSLVSLSNVVSSWCQLESLRFVSFPVQVLAKSCKVIPVMVTGKVLMGKEYKRYEYGVAVAICVGASIFMMAQSNGKSRLEDTSTSLMGYFLLGLYLISDSYTSQWQGHLFSTYDMSSYQMMLGVNLFSTFFTFMSLMQSGELSSSLEFVLRNPDCLVHVVLFSLAGVVGQAFIFHTIKSLGPMFFTMIMTARQILSIILSCLVFRHDISLPGTFGACLVFAAIGYQVYRKSGNQTIKKR